MQASLLFGYAQWGGIKEVCAAALLAPAAWLAVQGGRALALLVVVAGAICGVLGVAGAAYAAPALAIGAFVALRARPPAARAVRAAALLAGLLAVVLIPVLATLEFARQLGAGGGLVGAQELGNLLRPPPLLQGAGLWPVGELRQEPDPLALAVVAALTVLAAGAWAVVAAVRGRAFELPALVAIALLGSAAGVVVGSPWVDAKALAILAAVPLLAAAVAVARLLAAPPGPQRVAGAAGAAVLLAGCAWSTAAVARDIQVAPRERLAELREIGRLTAGRGPTLQLDFDAFGNRWFLRDAAPDGATDLRERHVRGPDGNDFPRLATVDVDDVVTADLWNYRILVRRRAPLLSRPPSAFRRIWAGASWEAWERAADAPPPAQRLRGGGASGEPAGAIDCERIADLADAAGDGRLAAVVREHPPVFARARRHPAAVAVRPQGCGRSSRATRPPTSRCPCPGAGARGCAVRCAARSSCSPTGARSACAATSCRTGRSGCASTPPTSAPAPTSSSCASARARCGAPGAARPRRSARSARRADPCRRRGRARGDGGRRARPPPALRRAVAGLGRGRRPGRRAPDAIICACVTPGSWSQRAWCSSRSRSVSCSWRARTATPRCGARPAGDPRPSRCAR